MQHECDKQSNLILNEFQRQRMIAKRVAQVQEIERMSLNSSSSSSNLSGFDPKEIDLLLSEITILHSRYQLYLRFLQRRITVSFYSFKCTVSFINYKSYIMAES